jgi:iron(III) transport system substrate-binding protein
MSTRGTFVRGAAALAAGTAASFPTIVSAQRRRNQVTGADVSKLYDAAKKEGTVVWWTGHYAQDAAEKVRDAFKAKYPGIEVQFIRQTGQVIFQRLTQDLKSNVHEVDVFASTDEAQYPILKRQNALASFVPADVDKLPAQFRRLDPDETYQLGNIALMLFNYNPKKVPAPKKWADLLDPKYKNQLAVGHPGFSGYVGNWALAMNDKFGWDNYMKKFAANNPKIGRSVFDCTTDIISGERELGPGADSLALEKKAQGNSVAIAFPEDEVGTVMCVGPVAVLRQAPHPNAARLFMNFYYSKEYAKVMAQTYNLPLLADVPAGGGIQWQKLKLYRSSAQRLEAGIPDIVAKWRETFNV